MTEKKITLKKLLYDHAFDFISLFLAISLGFIVDNYRDDRQSEMIAKNLSSDIVLDITSDTSTIQEMLKHSVSKKRKLEILFELIDDNKTSYNDSLIYVYSATVNHRILFERHASTITLLINSGDLNNLTKDAATAITRYDIECNFILELMNQERLIVKTKIYPFLQTIFHTENFQSITNKNAMEVKPVLRNWNAENRWLYHNYITELIETNDRITNRYMQLLTLANKTLFILKQEYNLR